MMNVHVTFQIHSPRVNLESEYTSSKVEPFKILHEINFHKVTNKNNQHTA